MPKYLVTRTVVVTADDQRTAIDAVRAGAGDEVCCEAEPVESMWTAETIGRVFVAPGPVPVPGDADP